MDESKTFITHAEMSEVIANLRLIVRESTKEALADVLADQLLDKRTAAAICGFKSYTTFAKLAKTPGFPLSINGKFRRAELEHWLRSRQGRQH